MYIYSLAREKYIYLAPPWGHLTRPTPTSSRQRWLPEDNAFTYQGYELKHTSDDLKLLAAVDRRNGHLIVGKADSGQIICSIPALKTPWSDYTLCFRSDARYLYLLKQNIARIFDMSSNAWVTSKDVALPFKPKRTWDNAIIMEDDSLLLLDAVDDMQRSCVHLLPSGKANGYDLESHHLGRYMGDAMVDGQRRILLGHDNGSLQALFFQDALGVQKSTFGGQNHR